MWRVKGPGKEPVNTPRLPLEAMRKIPRWGQSGTKLGVLGAGSCGRNRDFYLVSQRAYMLHRLSLLFSFSVLVK